MHLKLKTETALHSGTEFFVQPLRAELPCLMNSRTTRLLSSRYEARRASAEPFSAIWFALVLLITIVGIKISVFNEFVITDLPPLSTMIAWAPALLQVAWNSLSTAVVFAMELKNLVTLTYPAQYLQLITIFLSLVTQVWLYFCK